MTGAGPARAPWSGTSRSAVSGSLAHHRVDDRQLVAERLAGRGAGGDDDVPAVVECVDRRGLVGPQPVDAPGREALDHLGVQRVRELGGAGRAGRAARCGRRAGRRSSGSAAISESVSQASMLALPVSRPSTPTTVALMGLRAPRRRRSRRTVAGAGAEVQAGAAALADRDDDVADVRRVDRQAEPTERVEVVEPDAAELRVPAEVREQLQGADRTGVRARSCASAWRIR